MSVALWPTLISMTILAYWLCFRVPKGLWWSVGIVVVIMALSPLMGFLIGYAVNAETLEPAARGMAVGLWMWIFAPIVVWRGRARRNKEDALAWKYK